MLQLFIRSRVLTSGKIRTCRERKRFSIPVEISEIISRKRQREERGGGGRYVMGCILSCHLSLFLRCPKRRRRGLLPGASSKMIRADT